MKTPSDHPRSPLITSVEIAAAAAVTELMYRLGAGSAAGGEGE